MVAWGLQNASYEDTGLEGATTYYYKVSAKDISGNESSFNSEVSGTTDLFTVKDVLEDTYTDLFSPDANFGGDNELKINNKKKI